VGQQKRTAGLRACVPEWGEERQKIPTRATGRAFAGRQGPSSRRSRSGACLREASQPRQWKRLCAAIRHPRCAVAGTPARPAAARRAAAPARVCGAPQPAGVVRLGVRRGTIFFRRGDRRPRLSPAPAGAVGHRRGRRAPPPRCAGGGGARCDRRAAEWGSRPLGVRGRAPPPAGVAAATPGRACCVGGARVGAARGPSPRTPPSPATPTGRGRRRLPPPPAPTAAHGCGVRATSEAGRRGRSAGRPSQSRAWGVAAPQPPISQRGGRPTTRGRHVA